MEELNRNGWKNWTGIHTQSLGELPRADFALAFWIVHEVPDQKRFFTEIRSALKPGGKLLVVEPVGHVTKRAFANERITAGASGWTVAAEPAVALSHSVLMK